MPGTIESLPNVCPTCGHKAARQALTWQKVALIFGTLSFILGVLWVFASHFDATEVKAALAIATPFITSQIWPVIRDALKTVADNSASAGE